jgi:NAD(P)-dependent dehydrogenase (short-subunit alcohol dehydrogenase family)
MNVLLTGASSGLGIVLAKRLLDDNHFVVLHYNNHSDEVKNLHVLYPNNSMIYKCDLSSEESIHKMYLDLKDKNINCIINNAAIEINTPLEDKSFKSFIDVYKVNLIAPFMIIRYFAPLMHEGSIINISSDNAIDSYDEISSEYDCSKASLNLITKMYADKYKNLKVNAICFGWLDTKMNNFDPDIKELIDFVPLDNAVDEVLSLMDTKRSGTIKVVSK